MKIFLRRQRSDVGSSAPARHRIWNWRTLVVVIGLILMIFLLYFILRPSSLSRVGELKAAQQTESASSLGSRHTAVTLAAKEELAVERATLTGMDSVASTDVIELYVNRDTAEAAVLDRRTGTVWRTNPQDRDQDGLASPQIKGKLGAQLSLSYLMPNGQVQEYDSYNDSVIHKKFSIQPEADGMTVIYEFGNPEIGMEAIPLKISKERFEEKILQPLDNKDRDQMLSRFKFNEEQGIYERREIPKSALKRVLGLLEKAGYTAEDVKRDHEETGVAEGEGGGGASFTVPLRYKLDGEHLLVSIAAAAMQSSPPFRLHTLNILEFFAAAGKNENGYIFVPDGSGSLIHFNNGKTSAQGLILPVYGEDAAIYKTEQLNTYETVRMPVYGMKRNDTAFLAVIEQGDALAQLYADIGGRQHEYNWVGPQFTVMPKDRVRLNAQEELVKTPVEPYKGLLQIRYLFQNGPAANYSGMASAYRNYLMERYDLQPLSDTKAAAVDAPFFVETIGSVSKTKSFLGWSYDALVPLTTFEQAGQMADALAKRGITNIQMSYAGWMNGGIRHKLPTSVAVEEQMGGAKGLKQLSEQLAAMGGQLYPELSLGRVYRDARWNSSTDGVQSLARRTMKFYDFDPASFSKQFERFSHYLLAPTLYPTVMNRFLADADLQEKDGVALQDAGAEIYSNFRLEEPVLRQQSIAYVQEALDTAAQQRRVMLQGGNAYTLPYAVQLTRVPLSSNQFNLTDESVPFYAMVIHGLLPYAGEAFNSMEEQDVNLCLLQALETGSNVFFSWMESDTEALRETEFDGFYANRYEEWLDEAADAYKQVNEIYRKVGTAYIVHHERLEEDMAQTTYSNGVRITVNYGDEPFQIGGLTVKAKNYLVEEGAR